MSDEKKYTEREKVLAERTAIDEAVTWIFREARTAAREGRGGIEGVDARNLAATLRPLPKVTRPRVWIDASDRTATPREFRFTNGQLQTRCEGESWACLANGSSHAISWHGGLKVTAERIRAWADLLANPTEELEDGA